MYFDKFDICEAYYVYASLWHGGQTSRDYAIFGKLHRMGFKPAMNLSVNSLSENALEIYLNLVLKRQGKESYDRELTQIDNPNRS